MDSKKYIYQEDGQSILEIVFILPFLFLCVGLLYRMNMAIQMSIANVQHARSQIYVLAMNSPEYPRLGFRKSHTSVKMFSAASEDRMVLGVADPSAVSGSSVDPIPQIETVARTGSAVLGSSEPGEVKQRTKIRIRSTSAICTQLNQGFLEENSALGFSSKRWPFGMNPCRYGGSQ